MLTEKVIQHVVDSLREAYRERGWSHRELESFERLIRRRAEQINQLIGQVQGWAEADEVDYDVLCTLLGHLPSVHLYFENPFMMQMRVPLGELLLTLSDTVHENGELEGFELVPNDCPELQAQLDSDEDHPTEKPSERPRDKDSRRQEESRSSSKDDDLRLFRKAFEDT